MGLLSTLTKHIDDPNILNLRYLELIDSIFALFFKENCIPRPPIWVGVRVGVR